MLKRVHAEHLATVSALQERVLHDSAVMERLLLDLSINVTAMFRDPTFYSSVRDTVIPLLRTYPFIRIWHAGCSTGEEVYSMAILLHEEGLYDRCRIYATDINEAVLEKARKGIFPLANMQEYTSNYLKAGGKTAFSDYYTANYESAIFSQKLRENIVFAQHNLASDAVFNQFNLIVCRNVLIYFNRELQDRALGLFREALVRNGYLGLGSRETLQFSAHADAFEAVDRNQRLYRRR